MTHYEVQEVLVSVASFLHTIIAYPSRCFGGNSDVQMTLS